MYEPTRYNPRASRWCWHGGEGGGHNQDQEAASSHQRAPARNDTARPPGPAPDQRDETSMFLLCIDIMLVVWSAKGSLIASCAKRLIFTSSDE